VANAIIARYLEEVAVFSAYFSTAAWRPRDSLLTWRTVLKAFNFNRVTSPYNSSWLSRINPTESEDIWYWRLNCGFSVRSIVWFRGITQFWAFRSIISQSIENCIHVSIKFLEHGPPFIGRNHFTKVFKRFLQILSQPTTSSNVQKPQKLIGTSRIFNTMRIAARYYEIINMGCMKGICFVNFLNPSRLR
jgi:hypothetical protein